MSKQKTAMQIAIEKLVFQMEIVEMDYNNGVVISMKVFYKILKEIKDESEKLLELEKQQIIDAWQDGNETEPLEVSDLTAEEYFNDKFNNEKQ